MNLFKRWLWPHSLRGDAMSLYKKGLACSEGKNLTGAMEAYTSAIELPNAPADVKAMALYNRALILAANGAIDKALVDLQVVMQLPVPLPAIKLTARSRLERLKNRRDAASRQARQSTM
jgi:tetratricopeptide (TPR) repeat protein